MAAGTPVLLFGRPPDRETPVPVPGPASWLPEGLEACGERLVAALSTCDALVHLAYVPPPDGGVMARLRSELERNVAATADLMDAAAAAGVPYVAFASTSGVYPTAELNTEDGPLAPRSPYAVAKLVQEDLVRGWATDTGHPAAVLRLTTVFGPGEPVRRAIPRFITTALQGLPIPIDGDGAQLFAPVFVGDVATAFEAAVELQAEGTYNVGGEPRPVHEVADLVVRLCGKPAPAGEAPRAERRTVPLCDTSRAASVLGVHPTAIEAGLLEEIRWLRHQELAVPTTEKGGIQCA